MGHTILLADKSITIQKIVELTFADEDYVIKSFSDGQAALDAIPQLQPDLILADISLPGKTGYEVCRALRTDPALTAFSKTPIILLAGIYETMDEDRAKQVEKNVRESGANDFLSKPFDPQLLISKVRYVILTRGEPQDITGPTKVVFAPSDEITGPTVAVFEQAPALSEDFFSSSIPEQETEPPPDDGERTMMIPRPPLFSQNIFAENPPGDVPVEQETKPPVDVQAVSPEYEPVFEPYQAFPGDEEPAEEEVEELDKVEYSELDSGDAFQGHQEVEFTMPENRKQDEIPPVISMPGEEPFGEVFDRPAAPAEWSSVSASEEESPFGMPELPAPPVSEPEPVAAIEIEAQPALAEEVKQAEEEQAEEEQAEVEPTEGDAVVEQPEEVLEDAPVVDYEDTWPGVTVGAEQQAVEDLFENEPQPVGMVPSVEEEAELVADFPESEMEAPQEAAPLIPAHVAPVTVPSSVEITDELVDRIAERVAAKLSERVISEIVWQVVPDLAERMIRRELEKLHSGEE